MRKSCGKTEWEVRTERSDSERIGFYWKCSFWWLQRKCSIQRSLTDTSCSAQPCSIKIVHISYYVVNRLSQFTTAKVSIHSSFTLFYHESTAISSPEYIPGIGSAPYSVRRTPTWDLAHTIFFHLRIWIHFHRINHISMHIFFPHHIHVLYAMHAAFVPSVSRTLEHYIYFSIFCFCINNEKFLFRLYFIYM